jgi:asparagine synthase (glutamine-hydrolysing)
MCGISGIINSSSQRYDVAHLKAMTDIIHYRGPDDEGYALFDDQGNVFAVGDNDTSPEAYNTDIPYRPIDTLQSLRQKDFTAGFGHRRLAIQDLSAYGHLPMSYAGNRYWITFNGEIYNFKELKHELQQLGHSFISHTDTEVILAAYSQWGVECLNRFRGMWSFAIYDNENKEIFVARDRFGIKPLYYWFSPGNVFCFASEIKQFTILPGWKATLNRQRAFDYLVYGMTDHTAETMFEGVYHIPAGCYFKANISSIVPGAGGKIATTKWYFPRYKGFKNTFAAAVNQFKVFFHNAVKEHMVADVPLGSALSGGLDSSALVCEMNNILQREKKAELQKTFSYCSADERYNEKKWMDEVTRQTNVEAHYITENGNNVFARAIELIWHHDEPNQSQSELVTCLVYEAANKNNIKVLICGQGADEYLSGYEAFKAFRHVQLLKKGKFKKLNAEISGNQKTTKKGLLRAYVRLGYFVAPRFLQRYLSRKTDTYRNLEQIISFEKLNAREAHPFDSIPYKNDSIFNIAHKQVLHYPLQKYLRFEDRMSMLNSVEARVPFLDHRLVEFTTQLPADYLDGMDEPKKILKYGLKDVLPEKIRNRTDKIGFITSEENWIRQTHTKEFRAMLEHSISNSEGIIKPESLAYFDKICSGDIPFDYTYWRLIAFGLWMEKFSVQVN